MEKISKGTFEKLNKVILRMVPFLPGPELYDLFKELGESKKEVNQKIDKVYNSLRDASILIEELQSELNERTEKVKELKESYEKYSKLAEIEEDKIKPLMGEIEKTLGKNKGMKIFQALFLNLLAGLIVFILGIWLGPKITSFFSDSSKVLPNTTNKTTTTKVVEDSTAALSKYDSTIQKNN